MTLKQLEYFLAIAENGASPKPPIPFAFPSRR